MICLLWGIGGELVPNVGRGACFDFFMRMVVALLGGGVWGFRFSTHQIYNNVIMKQSEVVNLLDLINHISQSRSFKNSTTIPKIKKNKNGRYEEPDKPDQQCPKKRSLTRNSLAIIENSQKKQQQPTQTPGQGQSQSEFEHKMLKITFQIKKKKPKVFKIGQYRSNKPHISETDIEPTNNSNSHLNSTSTYNSSTYQNPYSNPYSNPRNVQLTRSSLYDNYCELMYKKRRQKNNEYFRHSEQQIEQQSGRNICNILDTINFDKQPDNQSGLLLPKSKTHKPGQTQKCKIPKQMSNTKVQPSQLSIQQVKSSISPSTASNNNKMPKIENQGLRKKFIRVDQRNFANQHYHHHKRRAAKISIGNLEGWGAEQDQEKGYFHFQYF